MMMIVIMASCNHKDATYISLKLVLIKVFVYLQVGGKSELTFRKVK
jgi:hypothetical protein